MPLIETKGAASAQGFGEFATSSEKLYIESCFSTYLYTGNSSTQTITNGIDLSGKGGLVWIKDRTSANPPWLYDTNRGTSSGLQTSNANAAFAVSTAVTAFNSNGFALGTNGNSNTNTNNYASWTFRKQAKFFDVVTYTGTGSNRTVAHNLGSVPGCIIVKRTNTSDNWQVYHRANTNAPETDYLVLNTTDATVDDITRWNDTLPTSTEFSLGTSTTVNASGSTYVAYLFAHDAGGFGLSGTDNVISCGHYTSTDGTSPITVNLGFEPQWILVKGIGNSSTNWNMFDVMRGWPVGGNGQKFRANTSAAETTEYWFEPTATGFIVRPGSNLEYNEAGGYRYIYIAIRRGPMKVPTSGTSVFTPLINQPVSGIFQSNILTDQVWVNTKTSSSVGSTWIYDRLRGNNKILTTRGNNIQASGTAAEGTYNASTSAFQQQTGFAGDAGFTNTDYNGWFFRRAPGFMDVVCWTGVAGTAQQINHNLSSVPEMIITKRRDAISGWIVYASSVGATKYLTLHNANAPTTSSLAWNDTTPTSTVFTAGQTVSPTGGTIVAYLFATVAGVSKVGSYTGSGTTKQIDCGFTAGARFVLIKRTDSTGDWYVYDSARGIVAGNDPYLFLNSTAAEVASTDYVDTYSAGFELSSTAPAALNANGGTYIFLAIA